LKVFPIFISPVHLTRFDLTLLDVTPCGRMQVGRPEVSAGTLYVQMFRSNVPVGTLERFYRNTVEISENSENHLKAIVGERQVAGRDGFRK
jgi:hypothetical protein